MSLPYAASNASVRPSGWGARRLPGWLVGGAFGALIVLWSIAPIREIFKAQLQLALSEESVPWLRAIDSQRSSGERSRLDVAAAASPQDYLLQVGRATALADYGGVGDLPPITSKDNPDSNDRTLLRLAIVSREFPANPGGYAHLARYMMASRVRIQRHELAASPNDTNDRSIPTRRKDVRLMEWAIKSGEDRDPDNAFWPAMLAITYFSAMRDQAGLQALHRAARKNRWDAYVYEEVLGQWRLYAAAYGDNGATQQIGPLSLIAFPHLRELRYMAQMARYYAEREAAAGNARTAAGIRRDVSRLALLLRDTARWAYEALIGTDLFFIANSDSGARLTRTAITGVKQWERGARSYLAFLESHKMRAEVEWLRGEVENCCELRERLEVARSDTSYPGSPPGIPLVALFGDWMVGVVLIQQIINVLLALLAALAWDRYVYRAGLLNPSRRFGLYVAIVSGTAITGLALYLGSTSRYIAIGFLVGVTLLALMGAHILYRGRQARIEEPISDVDAVEERWSPRTSKWMIFGLVTPFLIVLYSLRPELGAQHPVAHLLSSLMESSHGPTAWDVLAQALTDCALPLVAAIVFGGWALCHGFAPMAGIVVGMRRFAPMAMTVLAIAYLVMLGRTLRLDSAASHAINDAAANEFQWVLTHSQG